MGETAALPPAAVHAAPSAPTPAAAPPPVDDGIPAIAWLREMREMRHEQQRERAAQTDAFVGALDKLGDRLDDNMGAMRSELRRHLSVLVATFVLSFVVLGGLAGLTIYFKGLGVTASASPPPEETTAVPAPDNDK